MGFINLPSSVYALFQGIDTRLLKLEMSTRFTAPSVATDPTNARNGDIWLNTTTNQLKVKDSTGTTRVITWT